MKMTPRFLVDTDWFIDYLAGVESCQIRLEELGLRHLCVSAVTKTEVYEGVVHSRDPETYQERVDRVFQDGTVVVDLNDAIARVFGRIRGDLRKRGELIGDMDILIGSTALHYGIPLCTNNRRHFERIEGLELISQD